MIVITDRTSFGIRFCLLITLLTALACSGPGERPSPETTAAVGTEATASTPPAAEKLHHGCDVSGHSGNVDWAAVAATGHTFVFIKATEGQDLKDPAFDRNWPAARDAGIIRGAYHFYVTEDDPERQARFFTDTVALMPGDLAPVVDIELLGHGTKEGLAERLQRYLDLVEAHFGVKPIIYTSANFWDEHLTDGFGGYPLWIAEYEVDEPRLPKGWTEWHLWQHEGDAAVKGVEKGADLSRVNRSGPDLSKLVIH